MNAYKFVNHEVPALQELERSSIYRAIEAAESGDLKPLKEMYIQFGFGVDYLLKGYYKLQGWCFNISDYCKTYLVKYNHEDVYHEYTAPNKTCLYSALGGRHLVTDCIEKPNKISKSKLA